MTAFAELVGQFLEELFVLQPDVATAVGDHRFDDRWPDTSEAGRRARIAFDDRLGGDVRRAGRRGRSPRTSASTATSSWASWRPSRFGETELDELAWDPLAWVYLLGMGLLPLTTREFAPLHVRLASVAGRLEGIPRIIADAQETIGIRAAARVASPCRGRQQADRRDRGPRTWAPWPRRRQLPRPTPTWPPCCLVSGPPPIQAGAVLDAIAEHLATEVVPSATGDAALGYDLFAAKLRHTLQDPSVTPEAVLARAEAEFAAVRAEMVRIAGEIWPRWRPGEPVPDDDGAVVRGILDAIATDHPQGDEMVAFCRAELGRIESFCRGARRHRPRRRAARDRVDAGVHALVRRRDAGLARAAGRGTEDVLLDHAAAPGVGPRRGRVLPARDERPPAPAAHDPRGDARPLPPDGVRQPGQLARPARVPVRALRGGLGGLRHPGDARPRVRRRRSGPVAGPLEVLPASGRQRHPRRPHPHDGHDLRRGDRADGGRRVPGAGRGRLRRTSAPG